MAIALMILLILFGLLIAVGGWKKSGLRAQYPAPGKMVDIGGYQLHLQCQGEGQPVVVIDAGQGDFSLSWSEILPRAEAISRVCAYDRAGLGWSDPSPRPRTAEVMVDELYTLLRKSDHQGPYILVGASTGGMNMRLFAHQYPDEVAGMVLVDSAHEDQFSAPAVKQEFERMSKMMPVMMGVFQVLVGSGLAALLPSLIPDSGGIKKKLHPRYGQAFEALLARDTRNLQAVEAEMTCLEESQRQLREAQITSLGDIPLVVLRHGAKQPMMASPEVVKALDESFERLQLEMAGLSTNGRLVVAEESGHAIHLDQPDLVVDAIREVVESVRERSRETAPWSD